MQLATLVLSSALLPACTTGPSPEAIADGAHEQPAVGATPALPAPRAGWC